MKSQNIYRFIIGLSVIILLIIPKQVGAWGEFDFEALTNQTNQTSQPNTGQPSLSDETDNVAAPVAAIPEPEKQVETLTIHLDTPTLRKGYTVETFDNNFRVGIFPAVLAKETDITFKKLTPGNQWLPAPFGKVYVTPIYEFDIANTAAFKNKSPLIIEIKYPDDNSRLKQIYFWNNPTQEWIKLPTKLIAERQAMQAVIHLPYARLAVLAYPAIMSEGTASWYAYKSCDCAASPDYPKGSLLKVTNLDNYLSAIVEINDFGPERDKHPDRAIDLDVVAFKKIADKRLGLIKVRVEPAN